MAKDDIALRNVLILNYIIIIMDIFLFVVFRKYKTMVPYIYMHSSQKVAVLQTLVLQNTKDKMLSIKQDVSKE